MIRPAETVSAIVTQPCTDSAWCGVRFLWNLAHLQESDLISAVCVAQHEMPEPWMWVRMSAQQSVIVDQCSYVAPHDEVMGLSRR